MYERDGHCTQCGEALKISHRGLCEPCSKKRVVDNIEKARDKKCRKKKYEIEPVVEPGTDPDPKKEKKEPEKRRIGIW